MPSLSQFFQSTRSPVDDAVDQVMSAISGEGALELSALVSAAEEICGEPIQVEAIRQPRGGYGMCASTREGGHVIHVDPALSGDLRIHTVLHELGHILLGHNGGVSSSPDRLTALLTGDHQVAPVACVVPGFREWAQREADAERFASTVARRLRRGLGSRHLSRLDEAFG